MPVRTPGRSGTGTRRSHSPSTVRRTPPRRWPSTPPVARSSTGSMTRAGPPMRTRRQTTLGCGRSSGRTTRTTSSIGTTTSARPESMRRVILQELVSLDGFAAGPDDELDFFETVTDYGEVDADNLEMLKDIDTVLLGAQTYRLFVDYWPTAAGEPVAEAVNTIAKVVFSATLDRAPWGRWDPARVVGADATDEVARLKQQPGADMI